MSIKKKFLLFLSVIGPGIITANIDNDAGGIATYSLIGSKTGLRLLWMLIPVTISLILVQEMSIRIGIVTGKGLADLLREKFGFKITFYTLILLIFADLGNTMAEFAGIAASAEIFGVSKYISVPLSTLAVWFLVVKGNYKVVERIFLFGCLIYLSYIICGFLAGPSSSEVVSALFSPNFRSIQTTDYPLIVGLIGTTITPWMQFYVQSAVVEKEVHENSLIYSRLDVIFGCFFMSLVTLFIIICCSTNLYQNGVVVNTAQDAAKALYPLAGKYSSYLFAFGLFNASFFSAALLPLATSYYVSEGLGIESGLDKSFKDAPSFFTIFTFLLIVSALFILIPSLNLFKVLIWSQVINGILIPFITLLILNICNDPDILGEYTNGHLFNFVVYLIIFGMIISNAAMIYFEII